MNDEIKEILDDLKNTGYEKLAKNIENIIDYITNLQQENERLKHQLKVQEDLTIKNRMRKHIYKSRCEKAVEYINENVSVYAFNNKELPHWEFNDDNINYLLNILQNGSDDNE